MKNCQHLHFETGTKVSRLTEDGGDPKVIKDYMLDICIRCKDCGLPFEFVGLPGGVSFQQPMVNIDGTEARMPIRPSTDPAEILKSMQ